MCSTELTNMDKYIQIAPALHKKTNGEICILFDTMYSPAFPPTQADLHNTPPHEPWNPPLAQTDSSDTFLFLLFCPLLAVNRCAMRLIRLRAFSFFFLKAKKNPKTPLLIIARFIKNKHYKCTRHPTEPSTRRSRETHHTFTAFSLRTLLFYLPLSAGASMNPFVEDYHTGFITCACFSQCSALIPSVLLCKSPVVFYFL